MKSNKEKVYAGNLNTYMQEVNQTPLLSIKEEQKLFKQLSKSKDEDSSYYFKKKGEEARQKIIKANLKLVIKIAKEFRNIGLDYEDIINEGNIGLMNATEKYDLNKGAKFSYYASFWIKQSIRRAISNKGRTIRLPVGVVDLKLKVNRYIENYEKINGNRPSADVMAGELKTPIKKIEKILNLQLQSESLNSIVGDSEAELGQIIPDDKISSPSKKYEIKDGGEVLGRFIDGLEPRQRYIIIRRFGLDGSKPETLEVIGQKFDLTRERIRQLELTALRGLREMYKKINKNKFIE